MEVVAITLGRKAQVVIPKKARELIGLSEGKPATLIYEKGQGVILGDPRTYGKLLRGLGKDIWTNVGGDKYLKKERDAWEKIR